MKILIPLDGSPLAEEAIHFARMLAPVQGLEARLLYVANPYEGLEYGATHEQWQEVKERRESTAEAYLNDQASRLSGAGIPVAVTVCEGHPAREIEAAAAAADLIVMSTHGLSGLKRWTRGSVTDKVVRSGVANTLVVGPHAEEGHPRTRISSIMVPLDGSDLAEGALHLAADLAGALGARLHLVEAVPFPVTAEGNLGYMFNGEIYQGILDGAQAYLETAKAGTPGIDAVTAVLEGQPGVVLGDYINQKAIDLVVMTSHGRGGVVRTALGSITDRLIGEHAPVLVVHAKEEERK